VQGRKVLKVLILSHFYPPEMGGAAARVHGLSRWLVKFGHVVTVITGFPNYPSGIIPRHYHGKLKVREQVDGVDIIRTWVYTSSHGKNIGRLSNYMSFVASSVVAGLFLKQRFDVILASSPPLFLGLAGLALSRIRRTPFVLDVRDLWPDIAVEAGVFEPDDVRVRLGRKLANFLYSRAAHLTPVTLRKKSKILGEGIEPEKLTVVPNGVDFDELGRDQVEVRWREKLNLGGAFVVAYTGLIGIAQGVGIAVEAANLLKEEPDIHFLIVGDGIEREELMKKALAFGLKNISFVESQPRQVVPSLLAATDIALVPLVSQKLDDAVPSKLLEAWACRKPVLLVAGGEAADLVLKAGGGFVLSSREPRELADLVRKLASDREGLQRCAENGLAYVRTNFDRKELARLMENVLLEVSGSRSTCARPALG
jgi:glycosyltransferase involved in cell wall biosynthesis